ncbi:LptF/LptG family permease [Pelagibacteraceae bacterium]|jgi:lipopolysaccharide export system permease protein|nr:LptF/LptG family permease [Pelagibacteraceae bacterium]|tara:strand:+ start:1924 stop:3009 length:1086 start_codon:yes stop_codon:yes gene_type:complete
MDKILNKYLVFGFLKIILNVFLIFICLGIIMNLFEEIEFFKNLDTGIGLPFVLTVMFIPNLIIKLLPFIIFIAAMWFVISIKSNTDFVALKIFGYSNLKIIFTLSITAFMFGVIVLIAVNPVTSAMVKYYENTKAQYSKDIDHLVSINKNGVWIKETIDKKFIITTARELQGNFLYSVTIYRLNENNILIDRIDANKVDISTNEWFIDKSSVYSALEDTLIKNQMNLVIKSNYNIAKLNTLYKNLDTISFFALLTEYKSLNKRGYSKTILNEKLNSFISLPIFLFLMVTLACIFAVGNVKKTQNFYYIFISIATCVLVYYFKDLSIALGLTNKISLTLSVWMPIIAIFLFCSIGLIQVNEK